jgi:hypothetical protein
MPTEKERVMALCNSLPSFLKGVKVTNRDKERFKVLEKSDGFISVYLNVHSKLSFMDCQKMMVLEIQGRGRRHVFRRLYSRWRVLRFEKEHKEISVRLKNP